MTYKWEFGTKRCDNIEKAPAISWCFLLWNIVTL